jgi:hypothetical protein
MDEPSLRENEDGYTTALLQKHSVTSLASKTARGTQYESETARCLETQFGMVTRCCGGREDGGVDFRGHWWLPDGNKVYFVGQCKNFSDMQCGPAAIREFEGALSHESADTLGIMSSRSGFTESAWRTQRSSRWPIVFAVIDEGGKRCKTFVWNRAADALLANLDVAVRTHSDGSKSPVLIYKEVPLPLPEIGMGLIGPARSLPRTRLNNNPIWIS